MDLSNHIPLLAYCRQHGYSSRTAREAAVAGKIKGAVKVPANSPVGQWLVPADCDWTPQPVGWTKGRARKRK